MNLSKPAYPANYWLYRKYEGYEIQYNRNLHKYGSKRLKKFADDVLQKHGYIQLPSTEQNLYTESFCLDDVMYIGFSLRNEAGLITVYLESKEQFENRYEVLGKTIGIGIVPREKFQLVMDGQHRHEGVKHGDGKS